MMLPVLRSPVQVRTPQELELRKQKPKELLLEQESALLRIENPRMRMLALVQARRAAKPREQSEHWPRTLLVLARSQKKLQVRLSQSKNSLRLPRSLRAWVVSGIEAPFVRQAFPAGGRSSPASMRPEKRKRVASKQD